MPGNGLQIVEIDYRKMLPERNLTPESPVIAGLIQFERYDNRFHWNRPDSIIEIYVPLETAAGGQALDHLVPVSVVGLSVVEFASNNSVMATKILALLEKSGITWASA
jgi:hypothetical protein